MIVWTQNSYPLGVLVSPKTQWISIRSTENQSNNLMTFLIPGM